MTTLSLARRSVHGRFRRVVGKAPERPSGVRAWMAAEILAGALGFVTTVTLARRLGPSDFAGFEFAAALAGWLLVIVRGGIDLVAYREAARRPRLIGRLTDQLLGLRLVGALIGYGIVLGIAVGIGPERGAVVAVAGLALFPSALTADLAPRSRGRFGWVALIQGIRAVGYAGLVLGLISGSGQASRASWCAVAAETIVAALFGWRHAREFGPPCPRFRRNAWVVLTRRGLVAGLARLGRVGLYAAGVLTLGFVGAEGLGSFAASRRLVFGLVTLGLIVPASSSPILARAWASGVAPTRRALERATSALLVWAWPATVGLVLLPDRIMPALFGPSYEQAGPILAANAARLVPLLLGSLHQTALVACRREPEAMILVLVQVVLAVLVLPILASRGGSVGVGWGLALIEALGAVVGWWRLHRLRIATAWRRAWPGPIAATALMGLACLALRGEALAIVVGAGAALYAMALTLLDRRWRIRVLGSRRLGW